MDTTHNDIGVLVIEDHPLFSEALAMTLREGFAVDSVETVPTLGQATEALGTDLNPDIIILDLNLPDVTGMDGLMRLKSLRPSTPVIVVSSLNDDRVIERVMGSGASGFVCKDSPREKIIEAFKRVHAGETYTPDDYFPREPNGEPDEDRLLSRMSDLTPQQARILAAICEGKLNKQIAFDHSIAEATVKAHVTAILRKLGVQSRTQAVLLAQRVKFASILNEQ